MTFSTLMVHLEVGQPNTGLLEVAAGLAERCGAGVVGVVACMPMQVLYDADYIFGNIIEEDRVATFEDIGRAEAEFRHALAPHAEILGWRSSVGPAAIADFVARQARCADLVLTAGTGTGRQDATRRIDLGALVMQAGRPVLVVPPATTRLQLDRVLLCSRDTPESRRAASDALPLLRLASHVSVVEIAGRDELAAARLHARDVAEWLRRHGVSANGEGVLSTGDDAARVTSLAEQQGAGLIVAGAYGHARLREWAFGGVTRDVLLQGSVCALVSH